MQGRLSYPSVVATLALCVAIGGTSVAGAQALLSGRDVKDESLTGADVQNGTLTGADIREGSLGSSDLSVVARANLRGATGSAGPQGDKGETGAQGPAGMGVTANVLSGFAPIANYQDLDPIASGPLSAVGDFVVFAHFTVSNTGTTGDYLNCGLFIDGQAVGGGGVDTPAGATRTGSTVGAISVTAPTDVTLKCQGSSVTTFDISNVSLRIHNLG